MALILLPLAALAQTADRYIVELSEEPAAERLARPLFRQRVRAQQRQARLAMQQEQIEVLDSVDSVANAIFIRMPAGRAARLARIPGVKRVHQVREFHLTLDRALPVHRVPEAIQQIGFERAGAGVKVGIIDTGIDIGHPAFNDPSIPMPEGYPQMNAESDREFTNSKVIVARSYSRLFSRSDPDPSARDRVGHGTATAMAAAGVPVTAPLAAISGVAPRAWIGSYKVFGSPGVNDGASEDAILKAIDDAVADGMNVINLSLGSDLAPRLGSDPEVEAIERASAAGVIVVVSAGNSGPDFNTIGSPGTALSAITVGAIRSDRIFASSVSVSGLRPLAAIPGAGSGSRNSVTGPLFDVTALDGNGLGCSTFSGGSLTGRIAFIARGECLFEEKLLNAQRGGAIAALLYSDRDRPDAITMSVGSSTLPASMISYDDGREVLGTLGRGGSLAATISFTPAPVITNIHGIADFSSRGPNVDLAIKPDLVAVGTSFYTATQDNDSRGEMYSANGYDTTQGTSFSAPLVAGAAALLKAARPGLTLAQYRSLLIDTATAVDGPLQFTGAGSLNLDAAVRSTAAAVPAAVNFRTGGGTVDDSQVLTVFNVGSSAASYHLSTTGDIASLSTGALTLEPGASAGVRLRISGASLAPGAYEGAVRIADAASGTEIRVPYWYAVTSNTPRFITVFEVSTGRSAGSTVNNAVLFRITDSAGVPIGEIDPTATVVSGGGEILGVVSRNRSIPGVFALNLRLGTVRGANVVRIEAGGVSRQVTITGR
ncbi:MAG: S8 family serine peptidase [Bryobacteraceae bacterium]